MLAKVCSAALTGIEAYPVEVEVNAGYGVTTAIINSGYSLPMGRAEQPKDHSDIGSTGSRYQNKKRLPSRRGV
jgi:hypothetical protein